jgi:hypothetical protein
MTTRPFAALLPTILRAAAIALLVLAALLASTGSLM